MNFHHLRQYIVRPVLRGMSLYSSAAENLMLGTAAHESAGAQYLHQGGTGPAIGIYQVEPATYRDVVERMLPAMLSRRPETVAYVIGLFPRGCVGNPSADEMHGNLYLATAIARLVYFRALTPLPASDDIQGLAEYWKRCYNTPLGKGRVEQWVEAYRKYVSPSGGE